MTYDQYRLLPEDGKRYELVDPEKQTLDLYERGSNQLQLRRQFAGHETFESPLFSGLSLALSGIL